MYVPTQRILTLQGFLYGTIGVFKARIDVLYTNNTVYMCGRIIWAGATGKNAVEP